MAIKTGPALLAAGVSGLIANALVASQTVETAAFFGLLAEPLRWVVAIAAAGLLPPIYGRFRPVIRWFVSVAILTVVTAVAAVVLFDAPTDFRYVLAFHSVYAGVAATVYRTLKALP